jgi:PAS domain S-box-containing protein
MKIINTRVLIIDDDQEIWKAYQAVLDPGKERGGVHMRKLGALLEKDQKRRLTDGHKFELAFAGQGQEGYELAKDFLKQEKPFAIAFVDVRMPPGWDGMETAAKLHQIDPDLEIVIVTAYSDRSCDEIVRAVGSPHKLLFLRKPFDTEELKRLTVSLTDKWHIAREQETQRAELQTLLCTSPAAIFSISTDPIILTWNQSAEIITGYSAAEVVDSKCLFQKISDDPTCKNCSDGCDFGEELLTDHEFDILDKNGNKRTLSMRISYVPATKEGAAKSIGSFWDITTLKQAQAELSQVNAQLKHEIVQRDRMRAEQIELERKLHQAEKMEALGLMAGGVAHDLNNILSGLVGYPELLLIQLPKDSKMRESILAIKDSGMRAAAVVADLLTIARGSTSVRETVSLNSLIQEYLESPEGINLKSQYPDIAINTHLGHGKLAVDCSPVHVKKCVMNLLTNASEAIASKGKIDITTSCRHLDESEAKVLDVEAGKYVVLTVADDGPGISEADQDRIFEPFYTKKSMGQSGTGLGLTVVWNTVRDHKGTVTINSSSSGTTFTLYFPISEEKLSKKKIMKVVDDLSGTGSVLIVDDEPQQRDITGKMLELLGYTAVAVSSGEEALEYLKDNTVDLVLLDMIMDPGMSGRKTFERIHEINPGQKALFVSGYSKDEEVEKALLLGVDGFVGKPFTMQQIGQAVQEEMLRVKKDK